MIPRFRSQGLFAPATQARVLQRYANCLQTSWTDVGPYSVPPLVGVQKTMSDYVIPNFHKRLAEGEIFFNQMHSETRESDVGSGQGQWSRSIYNSCSSPVFQQESKVDQNAFPSVVVTEGTGGLIPLSAAVSFSDIAELQTEVSTRCLANRNIASNEMFESIAQINQAANMLKVPFASFYRFIKKNHRKLALMDIPSAWLAGRYGLKPLISDVTGILSGLDLSIDNTVRKTTRAKGEISRTFVENRSKTFSIWTQSYSVVTTDTITVRAMSLDEYLATTQRNLGFTSTGLLTLPWELIPYSFVVDWFANVEDFLRASIPVPGFKQLGSCLVTSRETETTYNSTNFVCNDSTYVKLRDSTGTCRAKLSTKTRSGLASPGLLIKSDFRFDKLTRSADALALIALTARRYFGRR